MKKIKIALLILISTFIFSCTDTFAITGSFEHNDFKYSIKKIHLDVYKSKLDSNNNFIGYENTKLYTIDLPDTFLVNPEYKDETSDDNQQHKNDITISMNLNATKEDILNLLKTKISTVDANNHYYIRMVVDFTMDSVPSNYTYYYQYLYNDTNNSISISSEDPSANSITVNSLTLGQTYSEVFNNFEYKLDNNQEMINYSNTYTTDMPIYLDFYLNYSKYSSVDTTKTYIIANPDVEIISTDPDTIIVDEVYTTNIIFIGYSNIQDYLDNIEMAFLLPHDLENDEDDSDIDGERVVGIPDTAKSIGLTQYMIGAAVLLTGTTIIVYSLKKKSLDK